MKVVQQKAQIGQRMYVFLIQLTKKKTKILMETNQLSKEMLWNAGILYAIRCKWSLKNIQILEAVLNILVPGYLGLSNGFMK